MEDVEFDALSQRLGTDRSRRWVFGGLITAVAGLTGGAVFGASDAGAKRRRRRKKKKVQMCHSGDTIKVNKRAVSRHLAHGDFRGPCVSVCPPGRCNVAAGEVCCLPGSAQNTDSCAPAGGTCCGAGGFVEGIGAACCAAGSKATSCPTGQVCCPASATNSCASSVGAC